MTDEQTTGKEIAVPGIGTVVSLDKPQEIAQALADIRDLENQLRIVKGNLSYLLVDESERVGSKTLHLDGMTVEISGGNAIEWDLEELEKLRDAGLPEARYDELVKTEVSYKVDARQAQRIAGANPAYATIIERARTDRETTPRVSVKR